MTATAIDYRSTQSTLVNSARTGGRGDTLIPHYDGGKIEMYHFSYTSPVGGVAAAKVISMGFLPQGRIIPHLTQFISTDFGGTGTVDVGFNEYKENDETVVAAAPADLWNDIDVSGARVNTSLAATGVTAVQDSGKLLNGFAEVIVTTATDAMQAGATIDLFIALLRGN